MMLIQFSCVSILTPGCFGRPTMDGKTALGASSPAKPALHIPDPLSSTRACTSSSAIVTEVFQKKEAIKIQWLEGRWSCWWLQVLRSSHLHSIYSIWSLIESDHEKRKTRGANQFKRILICLKKRPTRKRRKQLLLILKCRPVDTSKTAFKDEMKCENGKEKEGGKKGREKNKKIQKYKKILRSWKVKSWKEKYCLKNT